MDDSHDEPGTVSGRHRRMRVLDVPEFRALWGAEVISIVGDQLARVSISVLVYGRTGSAALSALAYALTFLPALLGGVLLGWLADRYPRRRVMITSDLLRAALALPMAWPGLPLPVLCALIVATVLCGAPHTAAQGALLPDVLRGDLLERGYAVRQVTNQTGQVAGFAAGGAVLTLLDPHTTLLVNGGTFALSALVVTLGVRSRPAPDRAGGCRRRGWVADIADGARTVFGDPTLRTLVLVVWLCGGYIAPEGIAVAHAAALGAGPGAVGALMAAIPAGSAAGAVAFTRWVPPTRRQRAVLPVAVAAGIPMGLSTLTPVIPVVVALWAVSGGLVAAALVQAQASFVRRTPTATRGRATGLAAAGLIGAQGLGLLLGGLAAERWSSAVAVGGTALTTLLLLAGLLVTRPARQLLRPGTDG